MLSSSTVLGAITGGAAGTAAGAMDLSDTSILSMTNMARIEEHVRKEKMKS